MKTRYFTENSRLVVTVCHPANSWGFDRRCFLKISFIFHAFHNSYDGYVRSWAILEQRNNQVKNVVVTVSKKDTRVSSSVACIVSFSPRFLTATPYLRWVRILMTQTANRVHKEIKNLVNDVLRSSFVFQVFFLSITIPIPNHQDKQHNTRPRNVKTPFHSIHVTCARAWWKLYIQLIQKRLLWSLGNVRFAGVTTKQ